MRTVRAVLTMTIAMAMTILSKELLKRQLAEHGKSCREGAFKNYFNKQGGRGVSEKSMLLNKSF